MKNEPLETKQGTRLTAWLQGVGQALPVVFGYLPIGFAYGVLAQKAGLSALNTLLMSVIVYAGSAQLIAVGLFAAAVSPFSIILTTFIVNLRHMLMAAALSPNFQGWKKVALAGFAYELTDETFALHAARFSDRQFDQRITFAINLTSQAGWVLGTWLGIVGGKLITEIKPLALDYALPAMFIALLVMQLKNNLQIAVAVFSGLIAVGLYLLGLNQWVVILATLIGATFGVGLEKWTKK